MSKKKIYVLDTNVLLTDSKSLYNFGIHDIVIPFKVLEELDKKKNLQEIIGSNARYVIRELDKLRSKGNLSIGVRIGKGHGLISIQDSQINKLENNADNRIISVAILLKEKEVDRKIVVVSRDIAVRVKCDSLGIEAEGYEINKVIDKREHIYSGATTYLVDDQIIDKFYNKAPILIEKEEKLLYPNQFVMLVSNHNNNKTALARFINYTTPLKRIPEFKNGIFGIKARNKEQNYLLDLLMDPKVLVITTNGLPGSGKTLLSLAAGLEQTLESKIYKRLIVIRPVTPVGKDLGFLPGNIQEKLQPWISPIVDNLKYLLGNDKLALDDAINHDLIEIEALTYIRGRSLPNSFLLIDEAQNLSTHELKTVLTRVGENTKIVLNGDLNQIDCFHINELTSGLTNVIENFKNQEFSGHITLVKGERSLVATVSSKIL